MSEGLHIGAQLYVSLRGQTVADFAVGQAAPGVAMATETLMPWLSAGKPIAAVAIARLWEQGLLDLDDPVAKFIPEFAARDKQSITLRHLLTHTAGIRWANVSPAASWDETIAAICDARVEPRWVVGRSAGYHLSTTWFILGEVVRRLSGQSYEQYVREEIFLPLGMDDAWMAVPIERQQAYGDRIGVMQTTSDSPGKSYALDASPENVARCSPGASARGPIRQLGRFYEMLLDRGRIRGGKPPILSPQAVEALTARHRVGVFDQTFKHVIDWGLGFIVNSRQYGQDVPYGFGPHASPRTFGHGGSQSSSAFADPEHGLAVAMVFNGMAGEQRHNQRINSIAGAIYEDLDLVSGGGGD